MEQASAFKTLGGDNTCEGQFSAAKHQVRRQNMMGRSGAKAASMTLLAGQYQVHYAGLPALMSAFVTFRAYHMDRLGLNPFEAFDQSEPWEVLAS